MTSVTTFDQLIGTIETAHRELSRQAKRAVNTALTLRNWLIGYHIAEYELHGADRADYGEELLRELSNALAELGLTNVGRRQLYAYLAFYRAYPEIVPSAGALFDKPITEPRPDRTAKVPSLWAQFGAGNEGLIKSLSYSHFKHLVPIEDGAKRRFYEQRCIAGGWSVRELDRQISSLYFERTALSTDKAAIHEQAEAHAEHETYALEIRDPYVFEFLGLRPPEVMGESKVEDALLDKLQAFLLELGHGFCFEARQKRLLIGETHFFVDLVFYHRVLKCSVLIELKVGKFTHENIGQLNTYLSWYKANEMSEGDNPPIGLLLCTEKDQTVVKYALAGMSNQLFVSKYQVELPTEEEIQGVLVAAMEQD